MPVTSEGNEFCRFGGFGTLSRLMNVGVLVLNSNAALDFANPQALELLGSSTDAQLKDRWHELAAQLGLDAGKLCEGAKPRSLTAELQIGTKPRSLRLEVYALEEEACTGYLVLLRDRRTADALETDLLLASQMRSLPHLYRVMVHDLKAPLNAMQLTLELLSDPQGKAADPAHEAKRQRYLAVLKEELLRLDRMLQTMLGQNEPIGSLGSVGSALRTFDFREIVREIAALLTPQARRQRVSIDTQMPEQPALAAGYRDRLKQAFLNIAINGLEAMPAGGRLAIRLLSEEKTISVLCQDDGPGIPAESLEEIYQIHFTTKKTGSGIGLYVARLVAESHGGDVLIKSEPGRGTRVILSVPRATGSQ
jgi:signal transduction histidine kinase